MPSTRTSPEVSLNWFFFNAKNDSSVVHGLNVDGHRTGLSIGSLDWASALKDYFRFSTDKSTLKFWKARGPVNVPELPEDWYKRHPEIKEIGIRCQPADVIKNFIGDSCNIHVFITAGELQEVAVQKSSEEEDQVSDLPLSAIHWYLRRARVPIPLPPSSAAPSKERSKLQGSSKTAICDGSFKPGQPAEKNMALPIQIYHPVFEQFLDRINDPKFEPDNKTITSVSKFMSASMELYRSESDAFIKLRPLLSSLVGKDTVQVPIIGSRTPDGLAYKRIDDVYVPLVCVEYKLASGEGNCDPCVQAAYSVREYLVVENFRGIFEKCCCPCFLLSGGGSHLSVLGVVFPYKFVVQRLTDAMWIGEATPHEEGRLYRIAKVFYALRLAVADLDEYYDQIRKDRQIPKLEDGKPHPRLFPYPTEFVEYNRNPSEAAQSNPTKFKYTDLPSTAATNVTFIAEVESPNRKVVVKFVERYGVEAHELLAGKGMAPRLLYCGHPDGKNDVRSSEGLAQSRIKAGGLYVGPIQMVIMEHIDGVTLDPLNPRKDNNDTRAEIEEAIHTLHQGNFVFGDLRPPNVMISKDNKTYLIDFDWSGREGEARYPLHLSKNVNWPEDPQELELNLIRKDHDFIMLDRLFSSRPVGQ